MQRPPLAAIGVFSAAPYTHRRELIRSTWLHHHHDDDVIVRFVIAVNATAQPEREQEAADNNDLLLLPTNITSRDYGPYLLMVAWLHHATTQEPFRQCEFIAKLDDDGYIYLPEYVHQLHAIRSRELKYVYMGPFMWSGWDIVGRHHVASSLNALNTKNSLRRNTYCKGNTSLCAGPYIFAAAPFQCVGSDLARALDTSERAAASIASYRDAIKSQTAPKRNPVMEDAWLGYALHALLPQHTPVRITIVGLNRAFVFDHYGLYVNNYTFIVHDKLKLRSRVQLVHNFTIRQHCLSNASLSCRAISPPSHLAGMGRHYGTACEMQPGNQSCRWASVNLHEGQHSPHVDHDLPKKEKRVAQSRRRGGAFASSRRRPSSAHRHPSEHDIQSAHRDARPVPDRRGGRIPPHRTTVSRRQYCDGQFLAAEECRSAR